MDNKDVIMLPTQKFVTASAITTLDNKIIVPPILQIKQRIMTLMHNHPTARHPG
jgi:hypothetical protein